jgi:hypothetical protein
MDFRSILKSLGQLSEATKETGKGRIHTAEPGGYGRKDDEDEEGNKVKPASTEKKGRGRPKKATQSSGEDKTYDTKSIGDVFGGGKKPKKEIGKVSKKHSLKDWIEHIDQVALSENQMPVKQPVMPNRQPVPIQKKPMTPFKANETEELTIQPAKQNTQVIKQGDKTVGAVENPGLAAQIKSAISRGEMSFGGNEMKESAIAEKATSKKQQKFMGMVHAAQKGEKPASKEVGKVAKTMKKSDVKDFAKTKHKGLPEKVKETKDLPGDQDKLDVAKPKGKLTSADFKELSKKKKVAESTQINEGAIKHLVDDLIADIDTAGPRSAFNVKGHNMERAERQILAAVQHDEKYRGLSDAEQNSLVRIALDFFRDEGELDEGIRTPNIAMGSTTTLPFGAKPSVIQQPAAMRKASGSNFPATLGQVGDRSNDLTSPKTTTGLMRDLSKKSPFAFEGKDMKDMQVESWSKQLNAILTEGITVSSSTGQQGAPDSVSVTASDADAQELMQVLRQAGIGGFGAGEAPTQGFGSPMSVQVGTEPTGTGTDPEMSPTVVGDGDDMLSLIKKMTGIQDSGEPTQAPAATSDYEDEEESGEEDYSDEEGSEEDSEGSEDEEKTDEGVVGAGIGAGLGAMVGGSMGAAAGGAMGGSLEEEDVEEGNPFGHAVRNAKKDGIQPGEKINVGGKEYPVKEEEHSHGHSKEEMCEGCGMTESKCGCDSEKVEENFANSANDPAETELMKLKALLSVGNDMHRIKTDQTVGNPTRVSVKESLYEWKKLSGIK